MIEPASGRQFYSLRVTGSSSAGACLRNRPTLIPASLHVQYDKAYRR